MDEELAGPSGEDFGGVADLDDFFLYAESTSESGGDSGDEDDAEMVENVLERAYTGAITRRMDPVALESALFFDKEIVDEVLGESSK
jgi:hypothetical protein